MAVKDTVAIIGAAGNTGSFIAKAILNGPYRLILMDDAEEALTILQSQMTSLNKNAEVDIELCCKDASWEADIIVLTVNENRKAETAQKMREVATCKTVINVTTAGVPATDLKAVLSYSKIINVSVASDITAAHLILEGGDGDAMEDAVALIKFIGLPYNVNRY